MRKTFRFWSMTIAVVMLISCVPFNALAFNPGDTVDGEYIVAYNPTESSSNAMTTGSVSGLRSDYPNTSYSFTSTGDEAVRVDANIIGTEETAKQIQYERENPDPNKEKAIYHVGDTQSWYCAGFNGNSSQYITFVCLEERPHCYVWTPVSDSYKLTDYNENYPEMVADEFERAYPLMQEAFGDHYDADGSGRVHLLYYNIRDGWNGGSYIAGYFSSGDLLGYSGNGAAMIHMDTYPALERGTINDVYGTTVHEYQHLINYSRTYGMSTMLNETMSMAAQEMIYPGEEVTYRINQWNEAQSYPTYHAGESIYYWDGSLGAYAMGCLFGQYIRVQTGGYTIFSDIIDYAASGYDDFNALIQALSGTALSGMSLSDLALAFRLAMVAKEPEGIYGFHGEEIFNDAIIACMITEATVYGCGAVVYAPQNNRFRIPNNASSGLVYYGVSNGRVIPNPTGIEFENTEVTLLPGTSIELSPILTPENAQSQLEWASNNTSVATVDGDGVVTGHTVGEAIVTATDVMGHTAFVDVYVTDQATFTVNFYDWDNTLLKSEVVDFGQDATPPEVPEREGYEFTGWDGDYTNVHCDLDIVAQYTIKTYTVTFYGMNETILDIQEVQHGQAATAPEVPEVEGYTFTGWSDEFDNVTSNLDITAEYEANEYTISYYLDTVLYTTQTYNFGDEIVLPEEPTLEGHYFSGWSGVPETMPAHDVNVYGSMLYINCVVTFVDGVTGEVFATRTVRYGMSVDMPVNIPVHEGYTFIGFDHDGSNITEDTTITAIYSDDDAVIPGDVNGDGKINTGDAVAILRHIAGLNNPIFNEVAADVNADGAINTGDAVLVLRKIAGLAD